jgi:hypothetical protein
MRLSKKFQSTRFQVLACANVRPRTQQELRSLRLSRGADDSAVLQISRYGFKNKCKSPSPLLNVVNENDGD